MPKSKKEKKENIRQCQLKLKLTKKQEGELNRWMFHLYPIWNWAIKILKPERETKDNKYPKICRNALTYRTRFLPEEDHTKKRISKTLWYLPGEDDFVNLLAGHSKKLGIPSHTIQGILRTAWRTRQRYCKDKKEYSDKIQENPDLEGKIRKPGSPRLKGKRNRLNSIPFPDPIKYPNKNRIKLDGSSKFGLIRFHKQKIPSGKIKSSRIVKRARGWYLCLFIEVDRPRAKAIQIKNNKVIGVDPGFKTNLTTTDDGLNKKLDELKRGSEKIEERLKKAQRGGNKRLVSRLNERLKNRRKEDNHKISRLFVEECQSIFFLDDSSQSLAKKPKPKKHKCGKWKKSKRFGRSVARAGHYQLKQMLAYKCSIRGRKYEPIDSKYTTMTCSNCGAREGPTGETGLSVRVWECGCGAQHDRDKNSAYNALKLGLGLSLETAWAAPLPPGQTRNVLSGRESVRNWKNFQNLSLKKEAHLL